MLVRTIPWKIDICMYNRENIDPRYLGLHVHLRSVRMLKTHEWYQSLGLFSIILDATCLKIL